MRHGCMGVSPRKIVAAWHKLAPGVPESIPNLAAVELKGAGRMT